MMSTTKKKPHAPRVKTWTDLTYEADPVPEKQPANVRRVLREYLGSPGVLPDGCRFGLEFIAVLSKGEHETYRLKVVRDDRGYTFDLWVPKDQLHDDALPERIRDGVDGFIGRVKNQERRARATLTVVE